MAIFLYGMFQMEDAIKVLSGKAFRRMIRQYTNGRLRSIGSGTLITAVLQSSSAVSLMVLAFVGAGVLTMENGVGVMMGSNIGTTLTAWIVAVFGFKLKIESFALPIIAVGGVILVLFSSSGRMFQVSRLIIGFGFLFLGLVYMKSSVENYAANLDISMIQNYGLWVYALFGVLVTALMQASAASIALVLTALNIGLINFDIAVVMVIGANVGTTITVLLGMIGAIQVKKRVGASHLVFNIITGIVAFAALKPLVWFVSLFFNPATDSVMGLALFHTVFNVIGVLIFLPFIGFLARLLTKIFPDRKEILTVFLKNTPTDVTDAAIDSLKKEILHLFAECQLYNLRSLDIDEKLVFDRDLPFEDKLKKRSLTRLYENVKTLHGEIFEFYAKLLNEKLAESEVKELERIIFASRNIMNSVKNIKGIQHNLDEFDASDNEHLNIQYKHFRRRLMETYHDINRIRALDNQLEQYHSLLRSISYIEQTDRDFIKTIMRTVADGTVSELEIGTLLMANRLFTQACRLQIFATKDLLLSQEQVQNFDHALDMKDFLNDQSSTDIEKVQS